jgi:hypothetical protein
VKAALPEPAYPVGIKKTHRLRHQPAPLLICHRIIAQYRDENPRPSPSTSLLSTPGHGAVAFRL